MKIGKMQEQISFVEKQFLVFSLLTNGAICLIVYFFRTQISMFYTNIEEIRVLVEKMMIYLSIYGIFLTNRILLGTILRSKHQKFFRMGFILGGVVFPLMTFTFNYFSIILSGGGLFDILRNFVLADLIIFSIFLHQNCVTTTYDTSVDESTIILHEQSKMKEMLIN